MKCANCGAENNSENLFCYNCGAKLNEINFDLKQKPADNITKNVPKNFFEKLTQKLSPLQIATIFGSVIVFIAIIISVVIAISNRQPSYIETTDDNYYYEDTDNYEDDSDYQIKLSDDYYLLAEGTDKAGNTYELVGSEDEDYEGISLKIGVIKNNKWLQELTGDMPFISENGAIKHGVNFEDGNFKYAGYGCFEYYIEYEDGYKTANYFCFYNSENSKYYDFDKLLNDLPERLIRTDYRGYPEYIEWSRYYMNEEGLCSYPHNKVFLDAKMILSSTADGDVVFLDKDSMAIFILSLPIDKIETCCQVSEGLFFVSNRYITDLANFSTDTNIKQYICDLNGKIVINLSKYCILYNEMSDDGHGSYASLINLDVCFEDGKATIPVINNNQTVYEIVIDKKGNVISNKEV